MPRRSAAGMAVLMALSACGHRAEQQAARSDAAAAKSGFVPPPAAKSTPLPGETNLAPLASYVGKYPDDSVGGVTFYDRIEVSSALDDAVRFPKLRHKFGQIGATTTPIYRHGTMIAAHGCEPHNCGDHNWTLFVPTAGETAEACYHDAATMRATSRWYREGQPSPRPGDCPSA